MNTSKIILGTLAGLAAGVLIGMLIAPEKGTVLRKNLVKKGEDFAEDVGEKIEENFDKLVNRVTGKVITKKGNDVAPMQKQEVQY